ncbi:MAG: hypothetical protein IPK65_09425 [Gammaproteobacteria bacterium]|nr:hypothetical protein [Gammaproteobacteria bacterium]
MRKIVSDVGYMGFSQLLVALSQIALQVYVVRTTTVYEYGEYIGSLVIVTLVEAIFVARGGELALRYVGTHWNKSDFITARQYATAIIRIDKYVNWLLYILLVTLAFATYEVLNLNLYYVIFLSLVIPAQVGYGVYKSLFIISSRLRGQSVFEIIFAVVQISTGAIGVYLFSIPGLIASVIGTAMVKTVLARVMTESWWPDNVKGLDSLSTNNNINITTWWSDSIHSIMRNSFFSGSNQIDIILLNIFRGAETVALYKVAKSLSAIPIKIAAPVWAALRPRIMKSWNNGDRARLVKIILTPSLSMLAVLPVMLLPASLYGDKFIAIIYGPDYASAIDSILVLLVGVWIFNVTTGWFRFWILIIKDRLASTNISAIQFFMLLVLGLLYGKETIVSMSEVVSVTMIVVSVMCWFELFRKLKTL